MYLRSLPHRHLAAVVTALAVVVLVPNASDAASAPEPSQAAAPTSAPDEVIDAGPTPPDVGLPPRDEQIDVVDSHEIGEERAQPKVSTDSARRDEAVATEVDAGVADDESTAGGSVGDVRLARTGFSTVAVASLGLLSIAAGAGLVRLRPR